MPETPYEEANRIVLGLDKLLPEGKEKAFKAPQLAHFPIKDTALVACLLTLGIPRREPGFYTDHIPLDSHDNSKGNELFWWVGDVSAEGGHKTEELEGAWNSWHRFKQLYPLHNLIPMREAIEARNWWVVALAAKRARRPIFPDTTTGLPGTFFITTSIREAAILKACNFAPIAFTGHSFALQMSNNGVTSSQVLAEAEKPTGSTPPQWMDRAIRNYAQLLNFAKSARAVVSKEVDGQTLILSVDATDATIDKFRKLL